MAGGLLGGLLNVLTGGSAKAPTVSNDANKEVEDEEAKAKKARSALLEAGAGGQGQLTPGQVGGNGDRVFGN